MRLLALILFCLLLGLTYQFWFGNNGMLEYQQVSKSVVLQQQRNSELEERNAMMRREVADLRNGFEGVEEHARNDLGMIRQGETFYRILPSRNPHSKSNP
ncbi:cell division protein FtsB [Dongshaea marina]|uniref:cell division protein FtsB n=1 Tax=Dongshaea marina TaxID=2047966 RepID=UPI000D3E7F8E|nr:cell division protein FtsB [Dongshaea marina]